MNVLVESTLCQCNLFCFAEAKYGKALLYWYGCDCVEWGHCHINHADIRSTTRVQTLHLYPSVPYFSRGGINGLHMPLQGFVQINIRRLRGAQLVSH